MATMIIILKAGKDGEVQNYMKIVHLCSLLQLYMLLFSPICKLRVSLPSYTNSLHLELAILRVPFENNIYFCVPYFLVIGPLKLRFWRLHVWANFG